MAPIKLSDYVVDFVGDTGTRHVFMLTGGGAMHLNDSIGRATRTEYVCTLHEQAAAMAAETYAKVTGGLGVCMVTTGPGGTNAVTGVAGAWLDSTPCLFISGQVKRADLKRETGVRQMGVQEVDIVAIVSPITKYAVTVLDPADIRYHLEKAAWLAMNGRPGPVWIDIPLDVQGMSINPESLRGFDPASMFGAADDRPIAEGLGHQVQQILEWMELAERPVVYIGNGVRLARAERELLRAIELLGVPVLSTWLAHDLVADDHPLFIGRPGPVAPRGANFAVQNSDVLLSIGARLNLVVTGYAPHQFARGARKAMVDVDATELAKMGDSVHLRVHADAGAFLRELLGQLEGRVQARSHEAWLAQCRTWKTRYPVVLDEYRSLKQGVSTYVLADVLSEETSPGDVIVSGSSGAGIEIFLLAYRVKGAQRVLVTPALGAMGYGIPASIGACLASGRRQTICVNGDGGLQLNIQELETIRRLNLPLKLFVLNNDGYASIRMSQQRYFGRLAGADAESGVTLPPLNKIAEAYRLPYVRLESQHGLNDAVRSVLSVEGPVLCEVITPQDQPRAPSLASFRRDDGTMVSRPIEDLSPFLDRKELRDNMFIPLLPESL